MLVRNVSDTARWVAMYRAMETDRPDALFRDPFARRLAGDRGAEILEQMPRGKATAWPMIVRTAVFDELILRAISRDGVDTILNLAAGLDVRPYRLALPPTLRWIDVDLPEILAYKQEIMANERPSCKLETVALDLIDIPARRALFDKINNEGRHVMVVSEGLLVYLAPGDVRALAIDLRSERTFEWWLFDLASVGVLEYAQKSWQKSMGGGTLMQFAPREGTQFFTSLGWWLSEFRLTMKDARRLHREMPLAWLFRPLLALELRKPQEKSKWRTGTVLLQNPVTAVRESRVVSPT
jgi:methyltransferase (TIGR00027 family)